ncbi:hypothetical protein QWZ06_15895 [Chryseobacterium tructae]|uniref:Uncharacterized protein n=1 Tax=Chryseobacterium tructae TaxID=1037380 RepID=A0ABV7Y1K2_9FLAO|nr:hypothetical protein [Chryseobacterium tructae]MDN3693668.1 hypothetical protein [Chryseobacterium tructae]
MKYKEDIIIILDSIVDDYYFLWECFHDYVQYGNSEEKLSTFSEALKEAYTHQLLNFFKGEKFNGDEILIQEFSLNDGVIKELLDYNNESQTEILLTTSEQGIAFLEQDNIN